MESVDDYTESRLESRGLTIRNYKRQENSCGITEINYDVVDRGAGCGVGAASGAAASVGGIITAIGISVLFPPAAIPALVTAGLSPYVTVTGGAAIGAAVGKNVHHTKIFHSTSGEFLGENKNDAAQKANNRGLQHCEKYQFEDAKNWFHAAYYTCTSGASKESQYKNNWEATKIAAEAQGLWNSGQLAEPKQKFQEACDKATVAELQTIFANRRDELNRLIEAESDTNSDSSAETESDTDRDYSAEAESNTNSDTSAEEESDTDRDSSAEEESDTNRDSSAEAESNTNSDTSAEEESDRNSEIYAEELGISEDFIVSENLEQDEEYQEDGKLWNEPWEAENYTNKDISDEVDSNSNSASSVELESITNSDTSVEEESDRNSEIHAEELGKCEDFIVSENMQQANEHYQEARRLWNEAWEAENDTNRDRSDEATMKYEQANCFFRKASECVPDNTIYQKWVKISSLKIEGNTLFNEGLSLQEQANALMQRMLYSKALRKYQEAINKFREGYDNSKDERFLACIDLVRSCIHETTEAMRNAQTVEGELNNERNDQANESYFFHSFFNRI